MGRVQDSVSGGDRFESRRRRDSLVILTFQKAVETLEGKYDQW